MQRDSEEQINSFESLKERHIHVDVSYLEIYNENVNDLLDPKQQNLKIMEEKGEILIENLTRKLVKNEDELI